MALRHILFDLDLFPNESERESSQDKILALLQALTYLNQLYLRDHPETPPIYKSGITYKLPEQFSGDGFGGEHFRDIPRILENGGGDCDNVASWRAAELREMGINARPYITWRKRADGGTTYHVIVLWPDGGSEDPSLLLGMGGADRADQRAEEVRKLDERLHTMLDDMQIKKSDMMPSSSPDTVLGHGGGGHGGGHGGDNGAGRFRNGARGYGWYPDYCDDDLDCLPVEILGTAKQRMQAKKVMRAIKRSR